MDLITKNANLTRKYDESFAALIAAFEGNGLSEQLLDARSRFNRAAHYRSEFIRNEVLPLICNSHIESKDEIHAELIAWLERASDLYRHHMARWNLNEILRDYDGYRKMAFELIMACQRASSTGDINVEEILKKLPQETIKLRA